MSNVKITLLQAGYCTCPEHIAIQGGRRQSIRFPARFALLEHPRLGPLLFDTGYSQRFFAETQSFPARFYRWLTPVTLRDEELAVAQLAARGIRPQDISRIFVSHFHADHIAALADFPCARFVYLPQAFEAVRALRGLPALGRAFLPGLLPADFLERSLPIAPASTRPLPPEYAPFRTGFDLLGDESLLAIELPGHATGQMGLLVRDANDTLKFFVADAAWLDHSIPLDRPPHHLADLICDDPRAYRATLHDLHLFQRAHPEVCIVPSHGMEALAENTESPQPPLETA